MKTTAIFLLLLNSAGASLLLGQAAPASPEIANIPASKSTPIPKHLIYRHFLTWVNDLNSKALAAGEGDPYKFADSFQSAQLETPDLDAVLKEAKALDSDLTKHGEHLKAVVAEYRRTAQNNAEQGLVPAPAEIHRLQAMRTAILVQHMVSLQSALGPRKSAQLDAYLEREFAPHMSLKLLARPAASIGSGIPTQPLSLGR